MRVATVITLLWGLMSAMAAQAADVMSADVARAAALEGEVVLVDIRTPEEWAATGVPDVAVPLNLHDKGFIEGLRALMADNPGKPLAMICATGGRSSFATDALEKQGVSVINVVEGMMGSAAGPGWLKRSLPVRTPDAPVATE
ncbi:MAG: rhodanese-like domain-containing protein [Pseudomonadota bacterium]